MIGRLIARELAHAYGWGGTGRGGFALPVIFFVSVAAIYPFAVGPDLPLLQRTGGGVIWIAALLAAILPLDRLVTPDRESGVLDQLALRGIAEEVIALAKIIGHWLSFGPPLLLATLIAGILLQQDGARLVTLLIGLAVGTPGLAALGVMVAALTASLRGGAALGGLLVLPLAVPLLIFGAGSLSGPERGGLYLLGAASLALIAIAPFAAGAAIRAGRG